MKSILIYFCLLLFYNLDADNMANESDNTLQNIDSTDTSKDFAVPLVFTVDSSSGQYKFNLKWNSGDEAIRYHIFKKNKSDIRFGNPLTTIYDAKDTLFIDENIQEGVVYDYGIENFGARYSSYGYISTGYKIPPAHYKGKILIIVDDSIHNSIRNELNIFKFDLMGDGWLPKIKIFPRTEEFDGVYVKRLKEKIINEFIKPDSLVAVLLFGRLPVAYSGNFSIDGHNDHRGAWSADTYYADMTGEWSDIDVNNTDAADPRNHNIPGDGKFDRNLIPSNLDVQLGRVDFYNLPYFEETEIELYKRYLKKNHLWRNKKFTIDFRGAIVDHLPPYELSESFSSNGWQNLTSLLSPDNINEGKDPDIIQNNNYLWYWATGSGSYNSSYRSLYSSELATIPHNAVFSVTFGSYNGDWDSENNVIRAAIASEPSILTCAWIGRPFWQFIHMGLGENIGYSALISQNNYSDSYPSSAKYGSRGVHTALFGDPTLKMHIIHPIDTLSVVRSKNSVELMWEYSSNDDIDGYYIYKSHSLDSPFELLSKTPVSDRFYSDMNPSFGNTYYMVRTTKLTNTPSGSFYNLGLGVIDSVEYFPQVTGRKNELFIMPNPVNDQFEVLLYLKNSETIIISLYDISGRKITDIFSGFLQEGWSVIQGIANQPEIRQLSTASYYITLTTTNEISTYPIIIQR